MAGKVDTAERVMARIGAAAHGVASRKQLLRAGLTGHQIDERLASGALIAVHRGVYRVGHTAPDTDASYLAAVLACGDVATWRGIPSLTVPATLVDIAARLDADVLARACHEAGVRYGTAPRHVAEVLARQPNAAGAARLRTVMGGDAKVSLSRLESRFLELLRADGLPLPETNRPAGSRRVDCRWPQARLTVELDSYRFHNSRLAWERDHAREREAYARGDGFRRYTWGDVFARPGPMRGELRELLR
jgi:hypothetical protein